MQLDVTKWLGIPYARSNCWNLCVRVYGADLGIRLPEYSEATRSGAKPVQEYVDLEQGRVRWREVPLDLAQPFDVLEMRVVQNEFHVGLCLLGHEALTTMRGLNSMVVNWTPHANARRRSHHELWVVRAWRHPEMDSPC